MPNDYLGFLRPKKKDRLDYGVQGMKWGQRRSSAELKAAAAKRSESSTSETKKPAGPESSADRYNRLKAQAKDGKGSTMSDEDLKFFNARTEALNKVNKMAQQDPTWLAKTSKTVLQSTAQKQMQAIADEIASKYISKRIAAALADNSAAIAAESKTAVDYVGKHRAKK